MIADDLKAQKKSLTVTIKKMREYHRKLISKAQGENLGRTYKAVYQTRHSNMIWCHSEQLKRHSIEYEMRKTEQKIAQLLKYRDDISSMATQSYNSMVFILD